jgi:hypothetical protein
MLENKLVAHESVELAADALQSLDYVERTFLKLAWFFENPDNENFDLKTLYKHLDDDWLEWALELITLYFREDTYLIKTNMIFYSHPLMKMGVNFLPFDHN